MTETTEPLREPDADWCDGLRTAIRAVREMTTRNDRVLHALRGQVTKACHLSEAKGREADHAG